MYDICLTVSAWCIIGLQGEGTSEARSAALGLGEPFWIQ